MNKNFKRLGIILMLAPLIISGAQNNESKRGDVKGPFFGQDPPGEIPVKFRFELVENEPNTHSAPVFSPDGKQVYITIMGDGPNKIKYSEMDENFIWSPLEETAFSSKYTDSNPFLSFDGSRLYFKSYRPFQGQGQNALWVTDKTSKGWSAPELVDRIFIHPGLAWQSSISKKGTIFFPIESADDIDIFSSESINGAYAKPVNLGPNVNSGVPDWQPCVAPDESYLIFASNKRTGGLGWGDLYVSFKEKDGTWGKAVNLGTKINTPENEEWPALSPDGKYLFFRRCEYSNNYKWYYMWVGTKIIDELKPDHLK